MRYKIQFFKQFVIVGLIFIPCYTYAAVYKTVDENGNISFTNIQPPSSTHVIKKTKETFIDPKSQQERIIDAQDEREEKKRVEEEFRRERAKIEAEEERERREAAKEKQMKIRKERAKFLSKYNLELNRLKDEKKIEEKKCYRKKDSECLFYVRKEYDEKIKSLKKDPKQYFYNKSH